MRDSETEELDSEMGLQRKQKSNFGLNDYFKLNSLQCWTVSIPIVP